MIDIQTIILHSPFNIELHKEYFTNYLEAIIRADGTVEYAIPSHQEKLIRLGMEKYNVSRDEFIDMCPEEYYTDYMKWLLIETECISVWTDFYYGKPNENQLNALKLLKKEGIYNGNI